MITNPSFSPSSLLVSSHGYLDICEHKAIGHKSLHTTVPFKAGSKIIAFSAGAIVHHPTYLTIQVADGEHITLQPEYLQYINHSCNPNVFFDTTTMQLVCIRAVEPGDELTFFYPSTEWNMVQPFHCFCEGTNCLRYIQGATHLTPDILAQYRLTNYIQGKLPSK